jgi:4'-phosphopantetheinyl transferase
LLDVAERRRAERFQVEHARTTWVAAHGALRVVLARYLDAAPTAVAFTERPGGKPAVVGDAVEWNLSHTAGLVAVAVTAAGRPVGVDVEALRALHHEAGVASRVLTDEEHHQYESLPDDRRNAFLLRMWARKEALVKASGEGIRSSLATIPAEPGPEFGWSVADLDVPGYAAAVSAAGRHWRAVVRPLGE